MNRHQYPSPPQSIQVMSEEAVRHHQAGRLAQAGRIYRQILALDHRHADSLQLLGMIEYQSGHHEASIKLIREAIEINNKEATYHSNLGTVLRAQGKLDEAAACYECALILKPDLAEIHYNLGNIFQAQNKLNDAMACWKRALELNPELPEVYSNWGNALLAEGKPEEALAFYERALDLNPGSADSHYNMGCALFALGKPNEAFERHEEALALHPGHPEARFSESGIQLLHGDFALGWRNYESRWRSKDYDTPMRAYPCPLWTGEKLASGRLLIWGEQGVGDEVMFAGLIPEVIRTGNRCLLDCDARLNPLFTRSFPGVDVVSGCAPAHSPRLDIAAHLPSGSLPGLFRTSEAAFAGTASSYLIADPVERERFRTSYNDGRRLVGITWQTKNRKTGRDRSIDLSTLAPLFSRTDIRLISLQYGDHDALKAQIAAVNAPILIDRSVDQFSNMDIFAAQVAAMDLVVTIDNSTAHLAGGLGVPVWVLLPFAPEWRWLQVRNDSPWYPTMRLFRQPTRGDWQSVIQTVQSALG